MGNSRDHLPPGSTVLPGSSHGSLSQFAYDHISEVLIGGTMRPGEKLILRPMAAKLGLSPTPVREALLRLVSEQALSLDERGSVIVPEMTTVQFREMCELRMDLEGRAAERAATAAAMNSADLEALQRLCDETVKLWNANAARQMLLANARFHRQVCRMGRAPLIQRVLEGLWIRLGPSYAAVLSKHQPPFAPGTHPHEQLVAALRTRDVEAAREASLQDVRTSERIIGPSLRVG